MTELTIAILTKNEEKNIVSAINNALRCTDDVMLVDSGSTDSTIELAKAHGARVIFRKWDDDFAAQRNFALEHTNAAWILYLDADERMDEVLINQVKSVIKSDLHAQYGFVRHMVFNGFHFRHGIFSPDTVYRLFRRADVIWLGKVHEHPECSASKKVLAGSIEHYTYDNWHHWLQKADHYTSIWAIESYQKGKRTSLAGAFCHSIFGGLRALFVKAAFLDGWMGIISCMQHSFYTLLKYVKLYEQEMTDKRKRN